MVYSYGKLLGQIKEQGMTQETLALNVGLKPSTLSQKLNNKAHFKQVEISKICNILGIKRRRHWSIFFCPLSLEKTKHSTY